MNSGTKNPGRSLSFTIDSAVDGRNLAADVTFVDLDVESRYKSSLALQGWVITSNGTPSNLVLTCKGSIVGATKFTHLKYPPHLTDKPGFHIRLGTHALPSRFSLDVWADIDEGNGSTRRVRIGCVNGTSGLENTFEPSRYAPIIVPAMGRSGTSLMMGLLNAHPEIVVPGDHPYEYRQASYFWHAIRILSSAANFEFSMHKDGFEQSHFYNIGYNPFIARTFHANYKLTSVAIWQDEILPKTVVDFFKKLIDDFIDRVLADSHRTAKYFAEKMLVSPLNDLVMNIYPNAKCIFLIRDIRDIFVSARAINKKRGTSSFNFEKLPETQIPKSYRHAAHCLVKAYEERDTLTFFVKYEDLIRNPFAIIRNILNFVGLSDEPEIINTMLAYQLPDNQRAVHMSTANPLQSIERWRNELSEDEQAFFSEAYRPFFETFGYPVK